MSYNLGWGNAVAVRNAFLSQIPYKIVFFPLKDETLNYPVHEGDAKLVEITKRVIERQTGEKFEHIFLTNGASGGATIAMRAFAQMGYKFAMIEPAPYFPIYPAMIQSAGLEMTHHLSEKDKTVQLVDSPANPTGDLKVFVQDTPVIWDAVYHSKVYIPDHIASHALLCNAVVGSYSKLLGLNGIRTGWLATNDPLLAERFKSLVTAEYCGLSAASTYALLRLLKDYKSKIFWENFEYKARNNLDYNREEISKLERFFYDTPVPDIGMFYYAPMDSACRKLLEKSDVSWTPGSSLGSTDEFGRLNVGQDCKLVRDAVKAILRNDKI